MMPDKIGAHHLERKAILYVRQSSAHQVLHNRESSVLQYAMRDRLVGLGWYDIDIVDDDLGRSASGSVSRAGFDRMVAEVCLARSARSPRGRYPALPATAGPLEDDDIPGRVLCHDRIVAPAGVREAIEVRGAEFMLLPSDSHDFNPIEHVFAKLKALLRKAAPRTRESLWRTIGARNVLPRRMHELFTTLRIRIPCVKTL